MKIGDKVTPVTEAGLQLSTVPCDGTYAQKMDVSCVFRGVGEVTKTQSIIIDYDSWGGDYGKIGKVEYEQVFLICDAGSGWAGAGAVRAAAEKSAMKRSWKIDTRALRSSPDAEPRGEVSSGARNAHSARNRKISSKAFARGGEGLDPGHAEEGEAVVTNRASDRRRKVDTRALDNRPEAVRLREAAASLVNFPREAPDVSAYDQIDEKSFKLLMRRANAFWSRYYAADKKFLDAAVAYAAVLSREKQ